MLIVTTDTVQDHEIAQHLGVVVGSTIQSKNLFADIGSSLKNMLGGELKSYTDMMENARKIATDRAIENAKKMGADAIVGIKIQTSSIMDGASELIVYGTAVKFK